MTTTVTPPINSATTPPAGPPGTALLRQLTGRYDGPQDLADQLRLAGALAEARETVPPLYRGSAGDILAAMYQARALDVPVMVALQQFVYNRGKGGMSGALMQGLIIRAGHRIEYVTTTDREAVMILHRCDSQPGGRASWTIGEAAVAKLTGKDSWVQYPTDMLFWRCLSRLARRYASDVVQGFGYTPEELSSFTADDLTQDVDEARPVDPDVEKFLADLDTLDYDGARAKWKAARKNGLDNRYAGTVDGHEVTVLHVITTVAERLRLQLEHDRAAAAKVGEEPQTTPDSPGDAAVLGCGCPSATVIATGDHVPGCPESRNPLVPVDEDLPQPDPTTDEEEGTPVQGRVLQCGCVMANPTEPHRAGCKMHAFEQAWEPLR